MMDAEATSLIEMSPSETGRAMGFDELDLAVRLATPGAAAQVPSGDARRRVRLAADERHDAWVVAWPAGCGVEMHDHAGSASSMRLVSGRLRERFVDVDGRVATRWLEAGALFHLAADHIHEVINVDQIEAVSVHAYSPPIGNAAPSTSDDLEISLADLSDAGLFVAA